MAKDNGPAAPSPEADRVAALEATVAELKALLSRQQPGTLTLPDGYRLVDAESQEQRVVREKSERELAALRKEVEKSTQERTQAVVDRTFPKGDRLYRVQLDDKNTFPELMIRADEPVDAEGRYRQVCGILSTDKPFKITPVAQPA
jgi:hypothetical protein